MLSLQVTFGSRKLPVWVANLWTDPLFSESGFLKQLASRFLKILSQNFLNLAELFVHSASWAQRNGRSDKTDPLHWQCSVLLDYEIPRFILHITCLLYLPTAPQSSGAAGERDKGFMWPALWWWWWIWEQLKDSKRKLKKPVVRGVLWPIVRSRPGQSAWHHLNLKMLGRSQV